MSENEPSKELTLREKLRQPLPAEAIKQHPTKSYMSSVNSMYVIERLNDIFGEDGWNAEFRVVEANLDSAMVVVECKLICRLDANRTLLRQTFGGNDNKDRGDAYKGACTDALTKAASQIGIAQDVYKGMYDKELVKDEDVEKSKTRRKMEKEQFATLEGIVNNFEQLSPNTVWLKVGETRCRVIDAHLIKSLGNPLGKKVEFRCRWEKAKGKAGIPFMTLINILGVWEPRPSEPKYEGVVSKCARHGEYPGEGNCPRCEEDVPF